MRTALGPVVAALLLVPGSAVFAQSPSPLADALRQNAQREQRILVAAAESMPAGKYGFKPTPAQMSFGQLVLHVAGSNEFMCSHISGTAAPAREKLTPASPKAELVAALKHSFAYCTTALADVTDAHLTDSLPYFGGRKASRAALMMGLAEDWADHYGAAAMYLRLNGILPPTARPGAM